MAVDPLEREQEHSAGTFERLLTPVLDAAYGTAFYMTHQRDDAEDLVQEAALLAFEKFHTFELGTNFKAWFFRIMINRFRNNYRRQKRSPQTIALDDAPELYMYRQTASVASTEGNENPAAIVIRKMSEAQIGTAMRALAEEYQIVCVLYFIEELSYQEIADIACCPIGTVRSRLHRGRKLLQKALWEMGAEPSLSGALSGK